MTVEDAIEVVLDLARQNVLTETDGEEALEHEKERQETAINVIDDFFCNVVFEGREL